MTEEADDPVDPLASYTDDDGYVSFPMSSEQLQEFITELERGPVDIEITVFENTVLELAVEHPDPTQLTERENETKPIHTNILNEDYEAKFYVDEDAPLAGND